MSWLEYVERVGEKPNSLVVGAVRDYVTEFSAALDLGAGNLRDAKFLKEKGFQKVTAVDKNELAMSFAIPGIEVILSHIEDYEIAQETFELVIACNSFFFILPHNLETIFDRIYRGLKPGGIFAFNMMGEEDDAVAGWNAHPFTQDKISNLCHRFFLEGIEEDRRFAKIKDGRKLWHFWSVIARKR